MDPTLNGTYQLMQETAGHYSQFDLDVVSNSDAVHFAARWHSTHRGQTIVVCGKRDGRVDIVAKFE